MVCSGSDSDCEFTNFDYEIDEDFAIDEDNLEMHNEYESTEVLISDDDFSNVDFDDNEDLILTSLPKITFVNEAEVLVTTTVSSDKTNIKDAMVCSKCNKSYKVTSYFQKHILTCGR